LVGPRTLGLPVWYECSESRFPAADHQKVFPLCFKRPRGLWSTLRTEMGKEIEREEDVAVISGLKGKSEEIEAVGARKHPWHQCRESSCAKWIQRRRGKVIQNSKHEMRAAEKRGRNQSAGIDERAITCESRGSYARFCHPHITIEFFSAPRSQASAPRPCPIRRVG